MIAADQPTCFTDNVQVSLSSTDDGTMLDRAVGVHNPDIVTNRTKFADATGISYGDIVYQRILYDETQTYDLISRVDERGTCKYVDEVHADALITQTPNVGLLLPIADCIATVFYDPKTRQLALAHLGRHSTLANLMAKTIAAMCERDARAEDIIIWMAPSVKSSHYVMKYFDWLDTPAWRDYATVSDDGIHLDLQGYNRAAALALGVTPDHVSISPINTAESTDYFSYSQGDTSGRFAAIAVLR